MSAARILVVDDSATIRRAVGERLVERGFEVDQASSCEEAIEKALLSSFDLVLSDIRMGAMTGVQLCRVLRSDPLTRDVPVVLLTASDDRRTRFWGRHAGADDYIAKHTPLDEIVRRVAECVARRPCTADEPARRPRRVDAAARVSEVLDRQLFDAVVASEARALMGCIDDRHALLRAAVELAGEILAADVVAMTLRSRVADSHAIVSSVAFDGIETARVALGLEPTSSEIPYVARAADRASVPSESLVPFSFPFEVAGESVGVLRLYDASNRLGRDDRSTAEILARSLAPTFKSALLVEEARSLARTDALTGLANRRTVGERLDLETDRSDRNGEPLSVLVLDIDHFKSVNDRFGHAQGDVVLVAVARAIAGSVRTVDLVGRWGGEEFVAVLPNCDAEGARTVAERVCENVRRLPPFPSGPEKVTVSCGFATRRALGSSSGTVVERADEALYEAKRRGRDRSVGHAELVDATTLVPANGLPLERRAH